MSANGAATAAASVPKSMTGYNKNTASAPLVSLSSQYNTPSPPASHQQHPHPSQPTHHPHAMPPVSSASSHPNGGLLPIGQPISSMLAISGGLLPIDHFRLKLYNYAMSERLRCTGYPQGPGPQMPLCPQPLSVGESPAQRVAAAAMMGQYGPGLALSMSLFQNRMFSSTEEPKPQHSYIGLIAIAILQSPETKLVLSDIYQNILDNYPYFRNRGPGWRNSIRHNLSLNDCFVKAGRSANGKGHYWAIHPANVDDFKKGDFRRRKAQRKVRKHMGLAVDDAGTDSPSPPPITDPFNHPWTMSHVPGMDLSASLYHPQVNPHSAFQLAQNAAIHHQPPVPFPADPFNHNLLQRHHQQLQMISSKLSSRKRQFDVASLLAPDDNNREEATPLKRSCTRLSPCEDSNEGVMNSTTIINEEATSDVEENIDVEANDAIENEEDTDEEIHREQSPEMKCYFTNSTGSIAAAKDEPLKRRRLTMSEEEEELQNHQYQQQQSHKFPWQGVIPMHKSLPVGFDKSLLERYYAGNHIHHHHHHSSAAVEDAHSPTSTPTHGEVFPANK